MRKMKDSGIEWIGEIPEGWEVTKIKHIVSSVTDIDHFMPDSVESGIPYLMIGNLKDLSSSIDWDSSKKISIEDYKKLSIKSRPQKGDIIFARYASIGTTCYIDTDRDFLVSYACLTIHPSDLIIGKFLSYYLKSSSFAEDVLRRTNSNTQGNVGKDSLVNATIVLPSIIEQTQIVNFLEAKCSDINAMLSKTRSSIEEYKKLKQAVITQAVTKGVRGEREMKDSGVEWIGEIPEEWGISRIKYVSIFEPSCDFRKLTPETIITYAPMECIKNGTFERRTSLYGNLAHTLTPFQDGDIVMAKVTPCFENGNIAIMNELQSGYGLGSSELFVFRPQNINTKYLFYWLQNKLFVHQACATMTGTGGLKRISPSFVKNCNIHYPPAAEQEEIADYLDAKCTEIDKLIAKKEQLVKELESYKKSLIYEVVTGKREV